MENIIITHSEEKNGLFLSYIENSPFYPDGKGGQLGDRGMIDNTSVLACYENYVQTERFVEPGEHKYSISSQRKEDIAQQHTAQHIISAAFENVHNIQTVGFRMDEKYSTIDLDVPVITQELTDEMEELSNKIVSDAVQVQEIITDIEGSKNFSLRKPLSEKIKGSVRLIRIGDFDICACAGYHVFDTSKIGLIKIIDKEKIKGNLTRIYYVAGKRAFRDYRDKNLILKSLSSILTTSHDTIEKRVSDMIKELKDEKTLVKRISEEYAALYAAALTEKPLKCGKYSVLLYSKNDVVSGFLGKYIDGGKYTLVIGENEDYSISTSLFDCKEFFSALQKKYGLRGGGNSSKVNFKGTITVEDILKEISII